ncbi:unnamed protein product [Notodromas monacha]|uniref:Zinc transporter ZIP13 n=1 Tax=Notodromas monacha TaxID=399045 RepID=A0A7R9BFQ5_9CRUS|nr:unnamed protein product [Notodromas monacha]CAG0914594.1 unnamed protein product [Notodromas monacha]
MTLDAVPTSQSVSILPDVDSVAWLPIMVSNGGASNLNNNSYDLNATTTSAESSLTSVMWDSVVAAVGQRRRDWGGSGMTLDAVPTSQSVSILPDVDSVAWLPIMVSNGGASNLNNNSYDLNATTTSAESSLTSVMWDSVVAAVVGGGGEAHDAGDESTWEPWVFSPWVLAMLASAAVGCAGIVPALFIPASRCGGGGGAAKTEEGGRKLRRLLSFSVGGLLGDVFLHLLPEAWDYQKTRSGSARELMQAQVTIGFWVLIGMLSFLLIEKIIAETELLREDDSGKGHNGKKPRSKAIIGYLNLAANAIDNFSHGLAVGGGFLCSRRSGLLTTLAILIHEVPHEISDFAILLNAGFTRWQAAKAQFATALIGLSGSMAALLAEASHSKLGDRTWWILPFTAGGFLTVSLVNVLPEIMGNDDMDEVSTSKSQCEVCSSEDSKHKLRMSQFTGSLVESCALLAGIAIMGGLANIISD